MSGILFLPLMSLSLEVATDAAQHLLTCHSSRQQLCEEQEEEKHTAQQWRASRANTPGSHSF